MSDLSIVGDLINFRGLVYAPLNENGVVFLFGKVMEDLNIYVEEIKPGFPDCIARRFTGKGWLRIRIEFEYKSKNFQIHGHDTNGCDIIVCWEHDWDDCPSNLEVIELKDVIQGLENRPIQKPDLAETSDEASFIPIPEKFNDLNKALFEIVRSFSDEIFLKRIKLGYTVYSPKRVFIYIYYRKNEIKLFLFTRGEALTHVEPASKGDKKGGQKWGYLNIESIEDLNNKREILQTSYELILEAVSNREQTGYYATIDEE